MIRSRVLAALALFVSLLSLTSGHTAAGAVNRPLIGVGDGNAEGVQSADATWRSQSVGYLPWIARQMGVPFSLPLIQGGEFTTIESTWGRSRLNDAPAQNLAVANATIGSLLRDVADSTIDTETDLVLWQQSGSQLSIAARSGAALIVAWIGNDDALGAVLSFDHLDASQLTPLPQFEADYKELVDHLRATGAPVLIGNIPDVLAADFLFSQKGLDYYLGSDFGLPDESYTTLVAMLLLRMGLADATLLEDPNWVLDPREVELIRKRTSAFNQIIAKKAAESGAALVDIHALFRTVRQNPPVIFGVPLSSRFNGGMFSLDGFHPSNFAHALIAGGFIKKANDQLGLAIPMLTPSQLAGSFMTDPFIDKDRDGRVAGRPGVGLLESLMPILGFSGDTDELHLNPAGPKIDPTLADAFMRKYRQLTGQPESAPWNRDDVIEALRTALGVERFRGE